MSPYDLRTITGFTDPMLQVDHLPLPHLFLHHYHQLRLSHVQAMLVLRLTKIALGSIDIRSLNTKLARRIESPALRNSVADTVAISMAKIQATNGHSQKQCWTSSTSETSESIVNSGSRDGERRGVLCVNSQLHPAPTVLESGWEAEISVRVLTQKRRVRALGARQAVRCGPHDCYLPRSSVATCLLRSSWEHPAFMRV